MAVVITASAPALTELICRFGPRAVISCISPGGEYERASRRTFLVPHEVGLTKKGLAPGAGLTVCGVFLDTTSSWHGASAHSTMSIARTLPRLPPSSLGMLIW